MFVSYRVCRKCITHSSTYTFASLSGNIAEKRIGGALCRRFDDNSRVCALGTAGLTHDCSAAVRRKILVLLGDVVAMTLFVLAVCMPANDERLSV